MSIPTYQIHNVLKIFSKRLFEEHCSGGLSTRREAPNIRCVTISADGKRRFIANTVTADIFNRLTNSCVRSSREEQTEPVSAPPDIPLPSGSTAFAYHLIDPRNRKTAVCIPLEDATALIGRFEDITAQND